jgi:hypothetical protein
LATIDIKRVLADYHRRFGYYSFLVRLLTAADLTLMVTASHVAASAEDTD